MAPNENIAVGRVLTTYKVADKAMDIPVVNDVVSGVKKMADPITPYVEGTLKMMKGKAEESLSPEVKEKVGLTLGSLGSKIDNLACNGLDQLTTAVPSLQTATTPELMENTKEAAISVVDTAQEYIASFKVARFGIRVFDAYLSVIEAPLSVLSSSVTSKVQGVRRHLRAVRRAGARRDGEPCQDGSLLMEMSQVFKINILLGFLGMQLVKIEEPQAAPTTRVEKEDSVRDSSDEEEDDPDYVPEHRESDDSLEYRSDTEATQESQDDDLLIVAELEDCPTTPNCEKVEHKIVKDLGEEVVKDLGKEASSEESEGSEESDLEVEEVQLIVAELEECPTTPNCEKVEHKIVKDLGEEVVKDLGKEASSEESEGSEESDLEVEEVQEVDSECNTPACEKPKHQVVTEVAEGVVKVLDNELEVNPEEIEVADIAQEDDQEKVEVEDIEVKENPEEVEVADIELEDNAEEVEVAGIELEETPKEVEVADIELEDNPEELEVAELEDCPTTPNCEKVEHKIVKEVAEDISKVLKRAGSSSSSDEDLN